MTVPEGRHGNTEQLAFRNPEKQPMQETVLMPPDEVLKSLADVVAQAAGERPESGDESDHDTTVRSVYAEEAVGDVPGVPPQSEAARKNTDTNILPFPEPDTDNAADPVRRASSGTTVPISKTKYLRQASLKAAQKKSDADSGNNPESTSETTEIKPPPPLRQPRPTDTRVRNPAVRGPGTDPQSAVRDNKPSAFKPSAPPPKRPDTRPVPEGQGLPEAKGRSGVTRVNPMVVIDRMGLLLQLQRRARTADAEELPFIFVNESRQLLPYRQSALFAIRRGSPVLTAVSGLAVADKSAPYSQWLSKFAAWRLRESDAASVQRIDFSKLTVETKKPPKWLFDWKDYVPGHLLWTPLSGQGGRMTGAILFFREEPFNESETVFATHLTESYGQSMALGQVKRFKGEKSRFPWLPVLLVALLAGLLVPVRQSVLAPSEITARRPALVRSGLEGVVESILVEPNQHVIEGEPLVRLEDTQLRTRLTVAQKAEDMASAEYKQLMQAALSDPKSKQRIPLLQGRMEQLAAETAYIRSLMDRIIISSPMRGVVLCDNPDEWLGRPVSLGQRIMLVADPDDLELEIRLPAAESLPVKPGDELMFFPNVSPVSPMPARVAFVGYRAGEVPGVGMAYILRAELEAGGEDAEKALLGLRGMAKLYGPRTPLGLNLLRKPIMAVRQWLGK